MVELLQDPAEKTSLDIGADNGVISYFLRSRGRSQRRPRCPGALEHLPDDAAFLQELLRILKPGGRVIINVPHLRPHSLLDRFRHHIGLTGEWHGTSDRVATRRDCSNCSAPRS